MLLKLKQGSFRSALLLFFTAIVATNSFALDPYPGMSQEEYDAIARISKNIRSGSALPMNHSLLGTLLPLYRQNRMEDMIQVLIDQDPEGLFYHQTLRLFASPMIDRDRTIRTTDISNAMIQFFGAFIYEHPIWELISKNRRYDFVPYRFGIKRVPKLSGATNDLDRMVRQFYYRFDEYQLTYAQITKMFPWSKMKDSIVHQVTLDSLKNGDTDADVDIQARSAATIPSVVNFQMGTIGQELPVLGMKGTNDYTNENGLFVLNNDEAIGVITSPETARGLFTAGTNRRVVEHFVESYWCLKMQDLKNTSIPDYYVRRDVSRNPEGTGPQAYQQNCKGCHAWMDPITPVFLYMNSDEVDFKGLPYYRTTMRQSKYVRGGNAYPNGFQPTDTTWNMMLLPSQREKIGWGDQLTGTNASSFFEQVGKATQTGRCMVKRVQKAVCSGVEFSEAKSELIAQDFMTSMNGSLRKLFVKIAAQPECTNR